MSPILEVVAPRLVAPAFMLAAALIVKGYTDVGDGFSAGVIVATAIALRYVALGAERTEDELPILRRSPAVAAAGLLVSLGVGFRGILAGEPPFTHLPPPGEEVAKIGSLELSTAFLFDVGLFLLVVGGLTTVVHDLARLARRRGS